MLVKIDYNIDGAKDAKEKKFFEDVALEIYNGFTGETSQIACGGFNNLIDALKDRGVDFKGTWSESMTDMDDPIAEELYDIFARGCFQTVAKQKKYIRNGRYLQLKGLDAIMIKDGLATICGQIMDL